MGTDALEVCPPCRDGEHAGDELTLGVCDCCGLSLEPPTDEACPDCRAEVGEPCTWACSSRWC